MCEGPWEFSKWNAYQSLTQQTLPTIGSFMLHYAWIRYIGMAPGKLPGLMARCMPGKGKCHLPMNLKDEGKRGMELINRMYEGFILYHLSQTFLMKSYFQHYMHCTFYVLWIWQCLKMQLFLFTLLNRFTVNKKQSGCYLRKTKQNKTQIKYNKFFSAFYNPWNVSYVYCIRSADICWNCPEFVKHH